LTQAATAADEMTDSPFTRRTGDSYQAPRQERPSTSVLLTPEEIRPFPRAPPRKLTKRAPRRGKCGVVTDTPEKAELAKHSTKQKV